MQEERIKKGKKKIKEEKIPKRQKRTADKHVDAAAWRAGVRMLTVEILWGCGAWVLGQAELLFGTYPLGLALLCGSAQHTVAILIGLLFTAATNMRDPIIYISIYLSAALIRVIASMLLDTVDAHVELPAGVMEKLQDKPAKAHVQTRFARMQSRLRAAEAGSRWRIFCSEAADVFSESVVLRLSAAAICSLVIGLYDVIAGGFLYYDLFGAIFAVVVCPVAALVYSVALERRTRTAWLCRFSEAALLFSLIYAAKTVTFLTFPLAPMMALFFALYVSHTRGAVQGIVTGVLCGIAYSPIQAPAFLLAALTYLFFKKIEKENVGILPSCAVAVAWATYVEGIPSLITFVPTALMAGMGFTIAQKVLDVSSAQADSAGGEGDDARTHLDSTRYQDSNERFRGISEAFSSLSEMFYNLSDRFRRPGTLDLRHLCDEAFDRACTDCPNKSVCWGLEYSKTLQNVNELISQLHTRGKVSRAQIEEYLQHRCTRIDDILAQINRECARLTGEMLRNDRTEIFAMDYESTAAIINDALEEDDGEYCFDPEMEKKIREYLGDAGVQASGVTVYGKRRRRILIRGVDIEHAKVSFETLRSDVGELCGSELGQPTFEVEHGKSTMILQAKKMIAVTGAQNNVSADGGVSGDTVNLFSNKKDYFYALISDGMGSGKEAALTSNLCSVFMEKMLRAGNRAGTSLRMLNNMIRSRVSDSSRECSSTIDLLELDLMTGEGSFIKSGAAPSFVVRGNVVQRLQAGTVPIGIICTLDVQKTVFSLREGDVVVMISDGILQSDPECQWLTSYLTTVQELTPEQIVYQICLHAAESAEHDDCSAIALRITGTKDALRDDETLSEQ